MTGVVSERRWIAAGLVVGVAVAASGVLVDAEEQAFPRSHDMVGTLSCTSASCHGGPATQTVAAGTVSRRPYVQWFATEWKARDGRPSYDPRARLELSDADPHALAAQR